jgi:hypothetical protein
MWQVSKGIITFRMIKNTERGNPVGFKVFPRERNKKVPALLIAAQERY